MWRTICVSAALVAATAVSASCSMTEMTATADTPWNLTAPPEGDVLHVRVAVGSSSCSAFDGIEVSETDVSIDLRATIENNGSSDCNADDTWSDQTVRLDAPVGDRALTGCRPPDGVDTEYYEREAPSDGDCRAAVVVPGS